jgi:hypothetical protein
MRDRWSGHPKQCGTNPLKNGYRHSSISPDPPSCVGYRTDILLRRVQYSAECRVFVATLRTRIGVVRTRHLLAWITGWLDPMLSLAAVR